MGASVNHALVAGVLLATLLGCRQTKPEVIAPWPDTTAAEWTVVSVFDRPLINGTRATVQTDTQGVGGYSGCNWYGMRTDTTWRGVTMTARACMVPAGVMEQERQISIALQRSASAVRSGDTLKVRDSTGTPVLTLLRRHPTGADAKQLTGTAWTFRRATIGALDSTVTLQFTADSVSGFAGCRHFTGTYYGKGDRLSFTSMSMEVDCPDARRQLSEGTFTTALSETSHFALTGEELILLTWGGDTLRFARRR